MQLHAIDGIILLGCMTAAFGGYRLGFVARSASWVGTALGLLIAVKVLPYILRRTPDASSIGRLGVVVLLLVAGSLLGQIVGLLVGSRLRSVLPPGPLRVGDRIIGALAGVVGVLVVLWFLLPAAANVPGWTAQEVRGSAIAQAIYNTAPKPPDTVQALRRLVGSTNFPSVFEGINPAPDTGPPPGSVSIPADVLARVKASTVKVEGVACHRTQDGSGFAIGPSLIATNAHVVAGEAKTSVLTPTGQSMSGTVVFFDPARDLALINVPHYLQNPLTIAKPTLSEAGAVFGHPGGQDELSIQPAAVRRQIIAVGRDLYDRQQTKRDVLILAAELKQGDSGGALVNDTGQVIGVAFAIAPDKPDTAYALSTTELKAALDQPRGSAVSTGSCLSD